MRERARGGGDHILSDNSVPASPEEGSRRHGDRPSGMETVFKADRCKGEGGGTILVRQKWSPQQVWREETCRQTTLETVFKVDVREKGEQK